MSRWLSCFKISCWFFAMRKAKSVGASYTASYGVTVIDSTPASAALMASVCVRSIFTYASNRVRLNSDVSAWIIILHAHLHWGSYCSTIFAHNVRAARNLAISMKKLLEIPILNLMLFATASMGMPASVAACRYSFPQARAQPSSWVIYAPALLSLLLFTAMQRYFGMEAVARSSALMTSVYESLTLPESISLPMGS